MKKIYPKMDLQRDSTMLEGVGAQLALLPEPAPGAPVTDALIFAQPDALAAFRLAQHAAIRRSRDGTEYAMADKDFYIPLRIDKGTWSKMGDGDAHLPLNKFHSFQQVAGNNILLKYLAHLEDCDVVPRQTVFEKENAELRAENALLRKIVRGDR